MKNRDALYLTAAALGGLAGAYIAARVSRAYRRDRRLALARLEARSTLVTTAHGPVELAEAGAGPGRPPVLVLHGAAGGYDQSLSLAAVLGDADLRFVALSRFGYLRTPLPANATPEAQADACAALLDALGLERAAVLAVSAGGMTGVAFALRHPDRCRALILGSAITRALVLASPGAQALSAVVLRSDFAYWALRRGGLGLIGATTGLSVDERTRLDGDPIARRALEDLLDMDPISRRRAGIVNDTVQAEVLPDWPLTEIRVPSLVIHGTADPLVPFAVSASVAAHIPNARLLPLEGAGHLGWFTHAATVRPAVTGFLAGCPD